MSERERKYGDDIKEKEAELARRLSPDWWGDKIRPSDHTFPPKPPKQPRYTKKNLSKYACLALIIIFIIAGVLAYPYPPPPPPPPPRRDYLIQASCFDGYTMDELHFKVKVWRQEWEYVEEMEGFNGRATSSCAYARGEYLTLEYEAEGYYPYTTSTRLPYNDIAGSPFFPNPQISDEILNVGAAHLCRISEDYSVSTSYNSFLERLIFDVANNDEGTQLGRHPWTSQETGYRYLGAVLTLRFPNNTSLFIDNELSSETLFAASFDNHDNTTTLAVNISPVINDPNIVYNYKLWFFEVTNYPVTIEWEFYSDLREVEFMGGIFFSPDLSGLVVVE